MSAGDTQPTQPIPGEWAVAQAPAPRRRRVWPWIVGFGIVIILAVVAWFVAEALARSFVTKTIHDEVITQLSLPADQDVDVQVEGAVIPQLIGGSFGEITVASQDVPLESFSGDFVVTATDVPIRGGDLGGATATVTLDEEQLRELMSTVDGFPAPESLGISAPDVTMQTELSLFGLAVPVGVALTPSAVDGQLVLSPSSLQVAGATVTAAGLQQQFGSIADAVLRDWPVCLAQYIPAGVTLTDVAVEDAELVADFDIAGGIVSDPALQANGTCS